MSFLIIGGKRDGQTTSLNATVLQEDEESYLGITVKEPDGRKRLFYMLAGLIPSEALKTYRERVDEAAKHDARGSAQALRPKAGKPA